MLIVGNKEAGNLFIVLCVIYCPMALSMIVYWIPMYRMKRDMELSYQENILRSDLATCFIKNRKTTGILAILAPKSSGVFVLTADELVFKSCPCPLERKYSVTISLVDCLEVSAIDFFGIRTGLRTKRKDGTMEQFIVNHRNAWLEAIQKAIAEKANVTESK